MSLVREKVYLISDRQKTFPGRKYNEPGKLPSESDPNHYDATKDYHIPIGNPNIEAAARASGWYAFYWDLNPTSRGVPVCGQPKFPVPIVSETEVSSVDDYDRSGTHTTVRTVNVDIHRQSKDQGGYGFDSE
jgi:hypothetical protein